MRSKLIASSAVLITAFLLATNPVVADAARLITGGDIKDNSVTGKDIKESTLATVPKANALTPLPSGASESGAFSAAAGNSTPGGWLGFDINYQRPLKTAIDESKIVDTDVNPDPTHCPGPGHASRGYLCLYFYDHSAVGEAYGYSSSGPYADLPKSVGVGLYVPVTGSEPYVDGIWTVTAP